MAAILFNVFDSVCVCVASAGVKCKHGWSLFSSKSGSDRCVWSKRAFTLGLDAVQVLPVIEKLV